MISPQARRRLDNVGFSLRQTFIDMPATLPAFVRQAAAKSTLHLPFRLPAKEWFTIQEAAALCGMSENYVEKKYDEGKLLSGHNHSGGRGVRATKRIPQVWMIAFMISTAEYSDPDLTEALIACLRNVTPQARAEIADACRRLNNL